MRKEHLTRALNAFGHESKDVERVLVIGAGNIGTQLCSVLKEHHDKIDLRVIEASAIKAQAASEQFPNDMILHGDALDKKILEEAGIENIDTLVAVTNDDEVNILSSLLASEAGDIRTITLVNKEIYTTLTGALNINAIVSPRLITASGIMKHVRKGRGQRDA